MAKADSAGVCSLPLAGHKQGLGGGSSGRDGETINQVYVSLVLILGI